MSKTKHKKCSTSDFDEVCVRPFLSLYHILAGPRALHGLIEYYINWSTIFPHSSKRVQ